MITTHGTRSRYRSGCRCVPCRAANARYHAEHRRSRAIDDSPRLVSATHTWTLVRYLVSEGYSHADLAHRLGLHDPRLRWHPHRIRVATALRVQRLYAKLTE